MALTVEGVLIVGSFLLFISILASKISSKLGIPTLLIFLLVGMIAGYEGLAGGSFKDPYLAKVLGAITLTLILFTGGLETEFKHILPILWSGISLSTLGIVIATVSVGYFVYWITDFSLLEGLLIGAIVSSTDAAAVFSIIRSRNMRLKANLAPTLELESGSNDTMAYFLMGLFIELLKHTKTMSVLAMLSLFFKEMLIGGVVGLLVGKAMLFIINKINLAYQSLYPGLALSLILLTYSVTDYIHGNGFLAVYIVGLVLGSHNFIHKKGLIHFCDGVAWLMQVIMFIVLGLLVFPDRLLPIAGVSMLLSLFIMCIARPLSVFASLAFSKFNFSQKLFISWVGLRGAVPIVFATYPLLAGLDKADKMYHIIFFVVLTSVLLQGTTLYPLAKWLGLEEPMLLKKSATIELCEGIKSELLELIVPPYSIAVDKKIVQLEFPKQSLIVLIKRKDGYVVPRGDTTLLAGDKLMIMTDDKQEIKTIKACLGIV